MDVTSHENEPTRRTFLDWVIGLFSSVTAAALTIPAVMYLWPAAQGGKSESVEVEGAASMSPGQSKMVRLGGQAVIVVRLRSGFVAYSAVCTHLGCLVKWDAAKNEFLCPCHAAVFDASGQVVSGPPPSPLPQMAVKEVGARVFVAPA